MSAEAELKEFLEDALTSPDADALDDAAEVIRALKQKRLAKKGICPCCGKKTEPVAPIPIQAEGGRIVGYQSLNCTCAEKRKLCVRCGPEETRTDELCEWCIKIDRIPHCALCRRLPGPTGGMCVACAKDVGFGEASVDPASPSGTRTAASSMEFAQGMGANMRE